MFINYGIVLPQLGITQRQNQRGTCILKGTATLMISMFLSERALYSMNFDTPIIKIG